MKHGTRAAAQVVHWGDKVDFYLRDYQHGKAADAKPVEFEEIEHEGLASNPTFSLNTDAAQELFEMLWSQGFRSKHDRGGADRLDAARQEHLADLREVAKLGRVGRA